MSKKQEDPINELHQLARDVAADKLSPKHSERLSSALIMSGKTPGDFDDLVAILKRAAALEVEAEPAPALMETMLSARQAVEDFDADTTRIILDRKEALLGLRREHAATSAAHTKAKKAADTLSALRVDSPELFALKPFALDRYTLSFGGSSISVTDAAAPPLSVSREILSRETSRRCHLLREAHKAAHERFEEKSKGWLNKFWTVVGWDGPRPELETPTWGDIAGAAK